MNAQVILALTKGVIVGSIQFQFKGKEVLITGGAQGIGRQMVQDFLLAGACVTVWDYAEKNLAQLEKDLNNNNLNVQRVDVSSLEACQKAAAKLKKPLDILVNNAGILRDKSLNKITQTEYLEVIQTNLNGVFYVTKSLLNSFQESAEAPKRIINISSIVALYGNFGQTNYVAAKSGVIGFTKVWARELAKKGFTVNAIAPGFIQTDILKNMPEEVMEKLKNKIPLRRLGVTKDISNACLFLCSEEAAYINGTVLEVTGGATV